MAEQANNKFYLTTPIYYVNARPHIGHAYTTIVADVLARRHRLLGDDTMFLTGTDEHGQKIERSAAAAGIPPQQFADQVSDSFRALWKRMGITNDDYIRTTEPRHAAGVQKLWRELESRGFIYLSSYTGAYCVSDEAFVDLPVGTPCPDCGRPLEEVTEENYFFKLSEFQAKLIDLIESGKLDIQPETRRNEVLSFLRGNVRAAEESSLAKSAAGTTYVPGALKDLSISRTGFKWGIPVPGNEKHVIYVWLDALANYMTAIGYGSDAPADVEKFAKFWPADLHLVGKEIIRFHCVYWPAFLLAADIPVPKKVQAHGWLLFEESKMSKSRGNIVRAETILDAFGDEVYGKQFPDSTKQERDLFASDVLRYFLLREIPFGNDGSFSFDALWQRYNADLTNGYGNLVSRTLNMIQLYSNSCCTNVAAADYDRMISVRREGKDPLTITLGSGEIAAGLLRHIEAKVIDQDARMHRSLLARRNMASVVADQFRDLDISDAIANTAIFISVIDEYISDKAPWKLAKSSNPEDQKNLANTLYVAAESIRIITALLYPVLPSTTAKVWAQLGLGDIEVAAKNGELNNLEWGGLKPGTKLGALAPIFPRADKGLAQIMTNIENPTPQHTEQPAATPEQPPVTGAAVPAAAPATEEAKSEFAPTITIDDFAKIDLRAATILVAERIPKADKLLRLEVDLGTEKRQILSGIAEHYTPEELIGRRIVIIANLAPRKMRGLESHGMLLAASEGENGKPILATFGENIAPGSRLK